MGRDDFAVLRRTSVSTCRYHFGLIWPLVCRPAPGTVLFPKSQGISAGPVSARIDRVLETWFVSGRKSSAGPLPRTYGRNSYSHITTLEATITLCLRLKNLILERKHVVATAKEVKGPKKQGTGDAGPELKKNGHCE